jgi:hypothetical protein
MEKSIYGLMQTQIKMGENRNFIATATKIPI